MPSDKQLTRGKLSQNNPVLQGRTLGTSHRLLQMSGYRTIVSLRVYSSGDGLLTVSQAQHSWPHDGAATTGALDVPLTPAPVRRMDLTLGVQSDISAWRPHREDAGDGGRTCWTSASHHTRLRREGARHKHQIRDRGLRWGQRQKEGQRQREGQGNVVWTPLGIRVGGEG